jgi:RND family efflux transporter MFP subunit
MGRLWAAGAVGLGLAGCSGQAQEPAAQPPLVRTALIEAADGAGAAYTGVVRARYESDLGFRVPGKITARLVDAGQTVRRGQVLARLDASDLMLGAVSAQATVAAADRSAAAARAEAVRMQADLSRFQQLNQRGFASGQRYEQAKAGADAAAATLAAAEAQARAARAAAGQAGNQASYSALVADSDGVVMAVLAEPGQVVSAGQPVVRLARGDGREAVVNVPETARAGLSRTATARLYGQAGQALPAMLRELSASADPTTRTYQARYALQGPPPPLGATVTVDTQGVSASGEVTAPMSAIQDAGAGPGVWVVDPRTSTVAFRKVAVAAFGQEEARLAGGVRAGERVVALGVHLLKPGQAVRTQTVQAAR